MPNVPIGIGIGVVGFGYWSPNLIRAIRASSEFALVAVCEKDLSRHAKIQELHPGITIYQHYRDLCADERIGAVVVATIPSSHFRIAKLCLESGKHVLVEKPLTLSVEEGSLLVRLAKKQSRLLMVDHTYLYSPAILELVRLVREGKLGTVFSIESTRINLGLFQRDINVVWDLAPHDISILLSLVEERPRFVRVVGSKNVVHPKQSKAQESVAYLMLEYASGFVAHVHVSWISPKKVRQITVIGSERTAVYDQLADDSLMLYEQGVYPQETSEESGPLFNYKIGERQAVPYEREGEDLARMVADFAHSIRSGTQPRSSAELGLAVIQILASAEQSLRQGGRKVRIGYGAGNLLVLLRYWIAAQRSRI